jgi:phosphoribosyl 1,2-cyclic phosphate phosphodiesterase
MASEPLRITVLGSGTSVGVPTIGCHCDVCSSEDPRDQRMRPSILVRYGDRSVVIDTTPDFRTQALRARIDRLDAVLLTHEHADHIMGLDDIRPFNFRQKGAIPVYGSAQTLEAVRRAFRYIFDPGPTESSVPKLVLNELNGDSFDVFGLSVQPVLLMHGQGQVYGFRFGAAAYLTDHSDIPQASLDQLQNLDVLFLDALRHKPHPTHSTVERSIATVGLLKPKRAYFTHISHDLSHGRTEQKLPYNVRLAYDGLEIEVGDPA